MNSLGKWKITHRRRHTDWNYTHTSFVFIFFVIQYNILFSNFLLNNYIIIIVIKNRIPSESALGSHPSFAAKERPPAILSICKALILCLKAEVSSPGELEGR
ncbi:hypothetical protein K2173_024333 [Erythroxylum novogranatense]|uniref:Uncharacterized protein n=1 Tax=Erythroxylum novogranatense TaxID=1862640 RepID=A0AAV8SU91_9ROSI|nr:hypothetical protein K2173_024333 [Erythroxylum novogranatense]